MAKCNNCANEMPLDDLPEVEEETEEANTSP
jgi:hypothetical protein